MDGRNRFIPTPDPEDMVRTIQGEAGRIFRSRGKDPGPLEVADPVNQLLCDLIAWVIRQAAIREEWSLFPVSRVVEGRMVKVLFDRTRSQIQFGFFRGELYLSVGLEPPERLRDMGDEFWLEVASLSDYGRACFQSNKPSDGAGTPTDKALLRKNKSVVFSVVRSCIFLEQEYGAGRNNEALGEVYQDFGSLEVAWPLDLPPEGALTALEGAFRRCYRIAYLLYRAEYLFNHARNAGGRRAPHSP